jgi:FixJ family two-component response regulator
MNRRLFIAVVDDEDSVRRALARLLSASQFDVNAFASGEEFLTSLPKRSPDCAILDLQMPGLTGRDVQRQLSLAGSRFPVIIITAHDQPAMREQCLADGAAGYFAKPFRRDQLIAAIHAAIRARRGD